MMLDYSDSVPLQLPTAGTTGLRHNAATQLDSWGISFPKSTSNIQTDLTRDKGWEILQRTNLKWVTLLSVNETWSAFAMRPYKEAEVRSGKTFMHKPAETSHEIHKLLQTRWSPRAFSNRPIETGKLFSLFEAARWSPSGGNGQPLAFIVATQDDPEMHERIVGVMTGRNPSWASVAPVLVLAVARLNPERPAANPFAYYDLGQAVAHLSVQASALGLYVRQMGGFDHEKACHVCQIPDGYEPMTLIAIGYCGSPEDLPDDLREREKAPRTRKPLAEFVFKGHWNQPLAAPETE